MNGKPTGGLQFNHVLLQRLVKFVRKRTSEQAKLRRRKNTDLQESPHDLIFFGDPQVQDVMPLPVRHRPRVREWLDAGAEINAQDKNGATALHRAVRTRCAAAVKYLLERGADWKVTNKNGSVPFGLAVRNTGRGGSGAEVAKLAQREIIGELSRARS
jgi:hypothetical protein